MNKGRPVKEKRRATFCRLIAVMIVATLITSCIVILNDAEGSDATSSGSCGPNLTYQLDDYGKLTISGTGNMTNYNWGESPFTDNTDIRTVVIEEGATSIGNFAFYGCTCLSSVSIPSTVESIGSYAFIACLLLPAIDIPNGVTTIGDYAFEYCMLLSSVTISNSVTTIGDDAFDSCMNLTSFNVGSENTNYSSENGVLFNKAKTTLLQYPAAKSDTSYTIPASVTRIDTYAFYRCTSLTSIAIPNSVTIICDNAFEDCTSLTSITIPNSVTEIGDDAFYGCTSLTTVAIPNSVTTINESVFSGCTSLTSITIPNSVTSIKCYAFENCTSLASITIPNSVTTIEDDAFYGCTSLASIDVSDGNANYSSDDGVLFNKEKTILVMYPAKKNTTEYSIPTGVEQVMQGAFNGCTTLTSIAIPNSVTNFDSYIFEDCTSLTSIDVSDGNANYSSDDGVLFDKEGERLFKFPAGKNASAYSVPAGTLAISNSAFRGCTSLTSITIPDSVSEIGYHAFAECTSLTSVTLSNNLMTIYYYTFSGCTSLASVTIPNSVTIICDNAFEDCTSLTSITIPNSVTEIGDDAFYGCTSLTTVAIPNSVTEIGDDAFYGCTSLTSVTISNSVTTINGYVFSGCTSLTSVTIPNSVTMIGNYAFDNCTSLTSVTIPNSVTVIGSYAFDGCTSLTSVTIPNSVTVIGNYAFDGCTKLASIEVEAGSANYSSEDGILFNNDKSVLVQYPLGKNDQSYTIPDSVTSIEETAFAYAESLMNINVSENNANFKSIDGILTNKAGTKMCLCPSGRNSVTVPDGVVFISLGAISGSKTTELIVPSRATVNLGSISAVPTGPSFTIVIEEGANVTSEPGIVMFSSDEDAVLTVIAPKGTVLSNAAIVANEITGYKFAPVNYIETSQGGYEIESDTDSAKLDSNTINYLKTRAESDPDVTLDVSLESGVKIVFDSEALKTLKSDDATLTFKNIPVESLDEKTKEIVGDNPVFDISFGDNKDFGDGKITITVPYILPEGKNADELKILYIADGEVKEKISCKYADGYITFETNHLSMYSVGFVKQSGGISPLMIGIIAVAGVAVIGGVAFFLIKRRS